ncbi:VOC family protein [Sphingomicrobium arenosum]|uniref:VOC family protein n=1 Tax=Sphingomicrobium arenosum TaxID=2233861 RepID=UPI002240EB32|nr:VOC family protein [Sphingomicrobium arenosum]
MAPDIITVLWFDGGVEEAARFYAEALPDTSIERVVKSPGDWPNGKAGDTILVDMTLVGRPAQLLNGGPDFSPNMAVSFMVETDDQAQTDRIWEALIADGGEPVMCGWCKDRYGFSWQVTPRLLNQLLDDPDRDKARRVFEAIGQMVKLDISALEAAARGE